MPLEPEQRAAVVAEARRWLGTPYHHRARLRGAGVDCAMLPAAVYRAVGLIPDFPIAHYPPDWHLHRDTERYLDIVTSHAREIPAPSGPGDFVLYRWGRAYAHGAIITGWPRIIHAMTDIGVVEDDGAGGRLADRSRRFFTLWGTASLPGRDCGPAPLLGAQGKPTDVGARRLREH